MDKTVKSSKFKDDQEERPKLVKCPADLQRLRIEKLMKNPDKPVNIPERPREKNMTNAPDFVRNVMGSSAGAGSGEFHVYRHLRRKEYARQKFIQEKSAREILDDEYHTKIQNNKQLAEDRTAKKRAKRIKKKQNMKLKGKKPKIEKTEQDSNESSDEDSETETDSINKDNNDVQSDNLENK